MTEYTWAIICADTFAAVVTAANVCLTVRNIRQYKIDKMELDKMLQELKALEPPLLPKDYEILQQFLTEAEGSSDEQ